MNTSDGRELRGHLYALFGMAIYLERKGIIGRAIPLVARILDCTDDEALRFHAGQRAQIEAWRRENASDYSQASVERAHRAFRLLMQHMEPGEAELAAAWRGSLGN